jgi:hypothetical protein
MASGKSCDSNEPPCILGAVSAGKDSLTRLHRSKRGCYSHVARLHFDWTATPWLFVPAFMLSKSLSLLCVFALRVDSFLSFFFLACGNLLCATISGTVATVDHDDKQLRRSLG